MSKLYIAEYANQALDRHGRSIPAGEEPVLANQVVDYSAGVAASANLNAKTKLVRVHTDAICSIKFGSAPVATVADARLAAGQTEYFGVTPESVTSGLKISGITNV